MRMAIASSDGKVVNQHFGRANKFFIIDVNKEDMTFKFIETRTAFPVCIW